MSHDDLAQLVESARTVRRGTIQVAEDIPEASYAFRPAPGSRSVAEILVHIAWLTSTDLLIHEATYAGSDLALAERANHSTSLMAARVASEANAKRLYLTHFSARYESEGGVSLIDLLEEARTIFPETYLARDFACVAIERKEA